MSLSEPATWGSSSLAASLDTCVTVFRLEAEGEICNLMQKGEFRVPAFST